MALRLVIDPPVRDPPVREPPVRETPPVREPAPVRDPPPVREPPPDAADETDEPAQFRRDDVEEGGGESPPPLAEGRPRCSETDSSESGDQERRRPAPPWLRPAPPWLRPPPALGTLELAEEEACLLVAFAPATALNGGRLDLYNGGRLDLYNGGRLDLYMARASAMPDDCESGRIVSARRAKRTCGYTR